MTAIKIKVTIGARSVEVEIPFKEFNVFNVEKDEYNSYHIINATKALINELENSIPKN